MLVNAAMLLGSLNNWLVVSPELIETFGLPVAFDDILAAYREEMRQAHLKSFKASRQRDETKGH